MREADAGESRPIGFWPEGCELLVVVPGIPPSASHVNNLINQMKAAHVRAVIVPSIYPMSFADLLARDAHANVVRVPYSVGAMGTTDYDSYIDAVVSGFKKALS